MNNRRSFIIGIKSTILSTKEIKFIQKYKPWGIILFSRNIKTLNQTKKLTDQIKKLRTNLSKHKHTKVVRNAMIKTSSSELSMDWDKYRKIDHSFSHVVTGEMPATNQKSSGRCWGFAGLNLFRWK